MDRTQAPVDAPTFLARRPSAASGPLVGVAGAFALGVFADRYAAIETPQWTACLGGLLLAAFALRNRRAPCVWVLLAATAAAGGAWRHSRAADVPPEDVGRFASQRRSLCRAEGRIVGDVAVAAPSESDAVFMSVREPRTRFTLRVDRLELADGWRAVCGRASVVVRGAVSEQAAGDRVRLVGWLAKPEGPSNPGEFDYAAFLDARGIRASIYSQTPQALETLPDAAGFDLVGFADRTRNALAGLLRRRLSPEATRVGEAFLLGIRSALPPDDLEAFLESGTVHIIVVSGLHVGLLAGVAWSSAALIGLTLRRRAAVTILAVAAYTILTGAHAPAVRAAVLTGLLLTGYGLRRAPDPVNSLAAAALVVLILDPMELFQTGAQLSFLCAFTLTVIVPRLLPSAKDDVSEGSLKRTRRKLIRWSVNLVVASAVLWIATAPLVLFRFHLFTPIAVVASAPLVAMSGATLVAGVAFFAFGWIPFVGEFAAQPLDWLLRWTALVSNWAASIEPISRYSAGPPGWWVAGFYAVLISPWFSLVLRPASRIHLFATLAWLVVGALDWGRPRETPPTQYVQLSVGHGLAGVLRAPTGRTVLLDCGAIGGPRLAERIVAPYLWRAGVTRIDAVVLSHSDIDHFNGLVRLSRRFPIGKVFVPPQFAAAREPAALAALEELRRRRIPVQFLWEEDELALGPMRLEVLHPPARFIGRTDNASSLVVRIEYLGRSVLFTADLADDGLERMLGRRIDPVDVLVAPHHGARASNHDRTADWARARVVVSSQGGRDGGVDPLDVYARRGASVFRTDIDGAATVEWTDRGMSIKAFRGGRSERLREGGRWRPP